MNGAGASYGDLLITSLVVLGVVCVAAFVAVRVFGRLLASGRTRGAHLMDVVARVPLEPRRSLYVVEVAGKTLLVGTSEMGLNVLSELDAGVVRERAGERTTFADLVKSAWARRKGVATSTDLAGGVARATDKLGAVASGKDAAGRAASATDPSGAVASGKDATGRAASAKDASGGSGGEDLRDE